MSCLYNKKYYSSMGCEQDGIIPINLSAFTLLLNQLILRYMEHWLSAMWPPHFFSVLLSLSRFVSSAGHWKAGEDPHPEEAACSGGAGWKGCDTGGSACCSTAERFGDGSTQRASQTEATAKHTAGSWGRIQTGEESRVWTEDQTAPG